MTALVLDNEAVQALSARDHPKHMLVLAHVDAQARRRSGDSTTVTNWVPTTVRVEAGWDRTDPSAARINRLRIQDRPLDADRANAAARLVALYGVSPADAHIGATVSVLDDPNVVVLTSDPGDIARICPPGSARIIRI